MIPVCPRIERLNVKLLELTDKVSQIENECTCDMDVSSTDSEDETLELIEKLKQLEARVEELEVPK